MWRVWRVTATLLGMALLGWSAIFSIARPADEGFYLFLGIRSDQTNCCNIQYYVHAPDGTPLFPVSGANYTPPASWFDVEWLPDGQGLLELNEEKAHLSFVSIGGQQRHLILEGIGVLRDFSGVLPAYSSEHHAIAYVADNSEIRILSADGQAQPPIPILETDFSIVPPLVWSPNHQWLYLHGCKGQPENACAIFRVQPDGTDWTQVTDYVLNGGHLEFKWSPDGKHLALVHQQQIWVTQPSSANTELYTALPVAPAPEDRFRQVLWSADSESIIYQPDNTRIHRWHVDSHTDHEIVVSANQQPLKLLKVTDDDWIYYWQIAEMTDLIAVGDLERVPLAGDEPQTISSAAPIAIFQHSVPIFTDNDWLIVAQLQADNTPNLYRMRPDGSQRERLFEGKDKYPNGVRSTFLYSLSPDQAWILVSSTDLRSGLAFRVNLATGEVQDFANPNPNISQTIGINPSPLLSMPYRAGVTALVGGFLIMLAFGLHRWLKSVRQILQFSPILIWQFIQTPDSAIFTESLS